MQFKRALAMLLALVMVVGMCPIHAFAADAEDEPVVTEPTVPYEPTEPPVTYEPTEPPVTTEPVVVMPDYPALELGVTKDVYIESSFAYFTFTAPEDGYYYIYAPHQFASETDADPSMWLQETLGAYEEKGDSYPDGGICRKYYMAEGTQFAFRLDNNCGQEISTWILADRVASSGITLDHDSISGLEDNSVYTVYASTYSDFAVCDVTWSVKDESVALLGHPERDQVTVYLIGAGNTTLTATNYDGYSVSIPIEVNPVGKLETGVASEAFSINNGDELHFSFTAPEDGIYYIRTQPQPDEYGNVYNCGVYIREYINGADFVSRYSGDEGCYAFFTMQSESSVIVYIRNEYSDMTFTTDVLAQKADPVEQIIPSPAQLAGTPGLQKMIRLSMLPTTSSDNVVWEIDNTDVAKVGWYDSDYGYVDLLAVGETTLTISSSNGTAVTVPILVQEPTTMEPDTQYSVSLPPQVSNYFTFTPAEDGEYCFCVPILYTDDGYSLYPNVSVSDEEYSAEFLDQYDRNGNYYWYYRLRAGTTVSVELRNDENDIQMESSLQVSRVPMTQQIIANYSEISGRPGEYFDVNVSMLPEDVRWDTTWEIEDPLIASIHHSDRSYCNLQLLNAGSTTLTVTNHDGVSLQIPITVTDAPSITLGETVSMDLADGDDETYLFTAEIEGYYHLFTPWATVNDYSLICDLSVSQKSGNHHYVYDQQHDDGKSMILWMDAAASIYISVQNYNGEVVSTALSVTMAQEPETMGSHNSDFSIPVGSSGHVGVFFTPFSSWSKVTWSVADEDISFVQEGSEQYAYIYAQAEGTTQVTATSANGLSVTLTVTCCAVKELQLDETVDFSAVYEQRSFYSFTAPQSGVYAVRTATVTDGDSTHICDILYDSCIGWYDTNFSSYQADGYYYTFWELEEGATITWQLSPSATMDTSVCVSAAPAAESLVISGELSDTIGKRLYLQVRPAQAGAYINGYPEYSVADWQIADICWQDRSFFDVALYVEGSTTLTVNWSGLTVEVPVTVLPYPALEVGDTVTPTLSYGDREVYRFTAPQDGIYTFSTPLIPQDDAYYHFYLTFESASGLDSVLQGTYDDCYIHQYHLCAGDELLLFIYNYNDITLSADVTVDYAPNPDTIIFEQEQISGLPGDSCYFSFNYEPAYALHDFTVTVADPAIAELEGQGDLHGYIKLLKPGETKLIVSCGETSAALPIVVETPPEVTLDTPLVLPYSEEPTVILFTFPESAVYCLSAQDEYGNFHLQSERLLSGSGYVCFADYWDEYNLQKVYVYADAGSVLQLRLHTHQSSTYTVSAEKAPDPTGVYFHQGAMVGTVGSNETVSVGFEPYDSYGHVSWEIEDENIATVEPGGGNYANIQYLAVGETVLTATCGELRASIPVSVVSPTSLPFGEAIELTLESDESAYIAITAPQEGIYALVTPNASGEDYTDLCFDLTHIISSNSWMQELSHNYAQGHAVILEMGENCQSLYRVHNTNSVAVTATVQFISAPAAQKVEILPASISGKTDTNHSFTVASAPWYAYIPEFSIEISDPEVAVWGSGPDGYFVSLLRPGQTELTATAGDLTASIPITVQTPPEVKVDQPLAITVPVNEYEDIIFTFPDDGMYILTASGQDGSFGFNQQYYTGENLVFSGPHWNNENANMYLGGQAGEVVGVRVYSYGTTNFTITAEKAAAPTGISLQREAYQGYVGDVVYIHADILPTNAWAEVSWYVEESPVVQIDHMSSNYICLNLLSEGTVEITVFCGDFSDTATVTAIQPLILTNGVEREVTVDPHSSLEGQFIAPADGIYAFYTPYIQENHYSYFLDLWMTSYWNGSCTQLKKTHLETGVILFLEMTEGTHMTFNLQNTFPTPLTTTILATTAISPTAITGTSQLKGVAHAELTCNIAFQPVTAWGVAQWEIEDGRYAEILDHNDTSCTIRLLAEGTTNLIATCGDVSLSIPIIVDAPTQLELDVPVYNSFSPDAQTNSYYYSFTAPEEGIYGFKTPHVTGTSPEYGQWDGFCHVYLTTEDAPEGVTVLDTLQGENSYFFLHMEQGATALLTFAYSNPFTVESSLTAVKAKEVTGVRLEPENLTLFTEGYYSSVTAVLEPEGSYAPYEWSYSGESITDVYNYGDMIDFRPSCAGVSTIQLTCGEYTATCTITVKDPIELYVNETASVTAQSHDANFFAFTAPEEGNYLLRFRIPEGTNFRFYQERSFDDVVEYGTYIDGDYFYAPFRMARDARVILHLENLSEPLEITATALQPEAVTELSLPATLTVQTDVSFELTAQFGSAEQWADLQWAWDEGMLNANWMQGNRIGFTPLCAGTTVITVSAENGLTASCEVTVSDPLTLEPGDTTETVTLAPDEFVTYCFTAPESGVYWFSTPFTETEDSRYSAYISAEHAYDVVINRTWRWDDFYAFVRLEEGEQIFVYLRNDTSYTFSTQMACGLATEATSITLEPTHQFSTDVEMLGIEAVFDSPTAYAEVNWSLMGDCVAFEQVLGTCVDLRVLGEGTATLTATCGDLSASTVITVSDFAIVEQPTDQVAAPDGYAYFFVGAIGQDLTYQWQYSKNGGKSWFNVTSLPGWDTDMLEVQATDARIGFLYRCAVWDANGNRLNSQPAQLLRATYPVIYANGSAEYTTLQDAFTYAGDGLIRLPCDVTTDIHVIADTWLDLNGHVLTGDITIEEGATLYVFDTATSDYTCENRGGIIGQITGDLARSLNTPAVYGHNYKYLAIEEEPGIWTFHRYYLSVRSAVLSPCVSENGAHRTTVNYKTVLKGSEVVINHITAYGAKLSGTEDVYTNFLDHGYVLSPGAEELNRCATMLGGTMKTTNTNDINVANAQLAPTVQAYIVLADGTELTSAGVSKTLEELVTYANYAEDLSDMQIQALAEMYHVFQAAFDAMPNVRLDNIRRYAAEYCNTACFTCQPESVILAAGENAVFHASYNADGLTYKWQYSKNGGTSWFSVSFAGYDTDTVTVPATTARDGFMYRCVITDADGSKHYSDAATLTVTDSEA